MKRTLLISAITIMTGIAHGQVTSGLVAKYSFNNGNANDEVGTNNGTVNGATLSSDRFGNSGKAYYFNGNSSDIDLGANAALKPIVGSISVWISMQDTSQSGTGYPYNPIILAKNTSNNSSYFESYGLSVNVNDSKIIAITTDFNTTNEKYILSSNGITNNTWYHLVMTYDNDSLSFYINGQLVNKIYKGFSSSFSATEPVYVGKSGNTLNDRFFKGSIDDIRIYNKVLTAQEVDTLFNEPNPMTVGINDNYSTINNIRVFPNPTKNQVNFSVQTNVQLTSVTGQIIVDRKNVNTLDLSNQPTGIYFLTLTDNNGQVIQQSKIIKE